MDYSDSEIHSVFVEISPLGIQHEPSVAVNADPHGQRKSSHDLVNKTFENFAHFQHGNASVNLQNHFHNQFEISTVQALMPQINIKATDYQKDSNLESDGDISSNLNYFAVEDENSELAKTFDRNYSIYEENRKPLIDTNQLLPLYDLDSYKERNSTIDPNPYQKKENYEESSISQNATHYQDNNHTPSKENIRHFFKLFFVWVVYSIHFYSL